MRPKKHETTRSGDLFRARLDQIINLKHELAQLADAIDWDWIDGEIAPLYSEKGRPGIETRFAVGLLLLKHIYGLSDEGVCERLMERRDERCGRRSTRRRDRAICSGRGSTRLSTSSTSWHSSQMRAGSTIRISR